MPRRGSGGRVVRGAARSLAISSRSERDTYRRRQREQRALERGASARLAGEALVHAQAIPRLEGGDQVDRIERLGGRVRQLRQRAAAGPRAARAPGWRAVSAGSRSASAARWPSACRARRARRSRRAGRVERARPALETLPARPDRARRIGARLGLEPRVHLGEEACPCPRSGGTRCGWPTPARLGHLLRRRLQHAARRPGRRAPARSPRGCARRAADGRRWTAPSGWISRWPCLHPGRDNGRSAAITPSRISSPGSPPLGAEWSGRQRDVRPPHRLRPAPLRVPRPLGATTSTPRCATRRSASRTTRSAHVRVAGATAARRRRGAGSRARPTRSASGTAARATGLPPLRPLRRRAAARLLGARRARAKPRRARRRRGGAVPELRPALGAHAVARSRRAARATWRRGTAGARRSSPRARGRLHPVAHLTLRDPDWLERRARAPVRGRRAAGDDRAGARRRAAAVASGPRPRVGGVRRTTASRPSSTSPTSRGLRRRLVHRPRRARRLRRRLGLPLRRPPRSPAPT